MPLKGYVCPPGMPSAGERHEVDFCLSKCPLPCVAPPLLAAIHAAETENHHKGAYISASMLVGSGCARQTVFERTRDFYEHPTRRYWPFRGTHAHSIIERAGPVVEEHGWLLELRLQVPLTYPDLPAPVFDEEGVFTGDFDTTRPLVVTLGGTIDAYNCLVPSIWDNKSMADAKAEMMIKGEKPGTYSPNIDDHWVLQTNIYAWMVAQTTIPPAIRKRYKLKEKTFRYPEFLGIQGIGMMAIPRTGAPYLFRKGRQQKLYEIDDVPLLDPTEVERFVRREALRWYGYLVLHETPPVVPADESWKCRNCPFNGDLVADGPCHPTAERSAGASDAIGLDE